MSENVWNRFKNKINNINERWKEYNKVRKEHVFEDWQLMICTDCEYNHSVHSNKCEICNLVYNCESCAKLNKIHLGFQMCQKCRIYNTENNKKVMISIRDARRRGVSRPSLHGLLIRPHSYNTLYSYVNVPVTRIVCQKELREENKSKGDYIKFD